MRCLPRGPWWHRADGRALPLRHDGLAAARALHGVEGLVGAALVAAVLADPVAHAVTLGLSTDRSARERERTGHQAAAITATDHAITATDHPALNPPSASGQW